MHRLIGWHWRRFGWWKFLLLVAFDRFEQFHCFQPERKPNLYNNLYRYRDKLKQLRELQCCNRYREPASRCQRRFCRHDLCRVIRINRGKFG
jgi:hypothetical protein